jgi:hypothetical protein
MAGSWSPLDAEPLGDGDRGQRVGRRDDRAERERRGPWQAAHGRV